MERLIVLAARKKVSFISLRITILVSRFLWLVSRWRPRRTNQERETRNQERKPGVSLSSTQLYSRLVRNVPAVRFGMDAEKADRSRCVRSCAGAFRLSGLGPASHAAPRFLSRRQHLLGIRQKPGAGSRVSHRQPARSAI